MKYAEFRQIIGLLAHEKATDQFKIKHPMQHLIYHNVIRKPPYTEIRLGSWGTGEDILRGITRSDIDDPYVALLMMALQTRMGGSYSEPSDPGVSRQPDLASIELHDVYEIKPDTPEQRKTGLRQLSEFKGLLQQGDREYLPFQGKYPSRVYPLLVNKTWREGVSFLPIPTVVSLPPPLGEIRINFSRPIPGLILWDTEGDQEKIKKRVEAFALDTLKSLQDMPKTEEKAQLRAKDLLKQNSSLGKKAGDLLATLGMAVVVIAVTAVIIAKLPLVATAVVFALIFTLCLDAARPGPSVRLT